MLDQLRLIPGADRWTRVSIQALHPFYTRSDSRVVANWMTRQDRELAIADNIAYVLTAMAEVGAGAGTPTVCVGFSQGVAMAYRAALHSVGTSVGAADGMVALAGDIPPELKTDDRLRWPPLLIGVGSREEWYTGDRRAADLAFLEARRIAHQFVEFEGGHEWTDDFRAAVGRFLDERVSER